MAKDYEMDACQMALAFVTSQPFVSSTLIGATNMAQLESNIDSITLKLSTEVKEEIATIRRDYPMLY